MGVKKFIIKVAVVLGSLYLLDGYLGLGLVPQPVREALARSWFILAVMVALLIIAYLAHKVESGRAVRHGEG